MRKKLCRLMASITAALILSGCQLMPAEETLPEIPIDRPHKKVEYNMTTVQRGDLILSQTVRCYYDLTNEETLSFSVGSVYIDSVYVTEGQQVQAGDLLATLDQENLRDQIATQQYKLDTLNLQKKQLQESKALDLQEHDILIDNLKKELDTSSDADSILKKIETQKQKRTNTEAQYAKKAQDLEDSIYLQELKLQETKASLETRQLRAGISGIVTFVRNYTEGQRSVKGQNVITISDWDSALFYIKGEHSTYFPVGTETVITANKTELEAVAVDPALYGIAPPKEDESPKAYLKLKKPDPTLSDGDKGSIELILDQRLNVLYVEKDAVSTANGKSFVYVLDENGLRTTKDVTTDMVCGDYIEIVSGLQEGDRVILE